MESPACDPLYQWECTTGNGSLPCPHKAHNTNIRGCRDEGMNSHTHTEICLAENNHINSCKINQAKPPQKETQVGNLEEGTVM